MGMLDIVTKSKKICQETMLIDEVIFTRFRRY